MSDWADFAANAIVHGIDYACPDPAEDSIAIADALRAAYARGKADAVPEGITDIRLGDIVTVNPKSMFAEDWRGQTLIIVGMELDMKSNEVTYTTRDPNLPNHGLTDGWKRNDFDRSHPVLIIRMEPEND